MSSSNNNGDKIRELNKEFENLQNDEKNKDWYWREIIYDIIPRKINYMPLRYSDKIIVPHNKDMLKIVNNDERFQRVKNPIIRVLDKDNLKMFTESLQKTNFSGPCTFVVLKYQVWETKKITYSFAVSNVIDPLEPGSKHDYLTHYIKQGLDKMKPEGRVYYYIIAGELNISHKKVRQMNFMSSATMTMLNYHNVFDKRLVRGDSTGERTREWDYLWKLNEYFFEKLKDIGLDATKITLPSERRGKMFSFIQIFTKGVIL